MTVKGQPWPSDLDNYDDDDDDDDENTDYEEFDMLQTCWIMISVLRPWSGWKVLPAVLETIPVDDIVTTHSVVVDDGNVCTSRLMLPWSCSKPSLYKKSDASQRDTDKSTKANSSLQRIQEKSKVLDITQTYGHPVFPTGQGLHPKPWQRHREHLIRYPGGAAKAHEQTVAGEDGPGKPEEGKSRNV